MTTKKKSIAIVGGGISGLAAACRCRQLDPTAEITIFESSDQPGGVLQTESNGGYLIEKSADMFTTEPPFALNLCEQLGHTSELIQTKPVTHRAFIATKDQIHPVPNGLSLMLPTNLESIKSTPLLDEAGKARFLQEQKLPPKLDEQDESLESFAVRRFGKQAFERLFQPLVSGIYTADPKKLSLRSTLKRFLDMERKHGSLIDAGLKKCKSRSVESEASGARYSLFRAPNRGMGQWIEWLREATPNLKIETKTRIDSIEKKSLWMLSNENFERPFDSVVLATPAKASGRIIANVSSPLTEQLESIDAASSAIVVLGFDKAQIRRPFEGFGIVMPHYLNRKLIAASFSSNKFEGRAPEDKILIRCFVGGALQGHLLEENNDSGLLELAKNELNQLLGVDGTPEISRVFRWKKCMPQYHLGHFDRVSRIEKLVTDLPGIELTGNSYRGVGIPICLQEGFAAAERTIGYLERI